MWGDLDIVCDINVVNEHACISVMACFKVATSLSSVEIMGF